MAHDVAPKSNKNLDRHVEVAPKLGWPNFDFLAPYRKQNNLILNVLFWIVSLAKVCPIFKFRTFLES